MKYFTAPNFTALAAALALSVMLVNATMTVPLGAAAFLA